MMLSMSCTRVRFSGGAIFFNDTVSQSGAWSYAKPLRLDPVWPYSFQPLTRFSTPLPTCV